MIQTPEPDRESIVSERFAADAYVASQGFVLQAVTDDAVEVAVTIREDQTNFHGGPHGGMIFALADCAFSLACNAYTEVAVGIDTHMVYTAPCKVGDRLSAIAKEVTRGRTLGSYQVTVTRPDGRTIALFTGTVLILD